MHLDLFAGNWIWIKLFINCVWWYTVAWCTVACATIHHHQFCLFCILDINEQIFCYYQRINHVSLNVIRFVLRFFLTKLLLIVWIHRNDKDLDQNIEILNPIQFGSNITFFPSFDRFRQILPNKSKWIVMMQVNVSNVRKRKLKFHNISPNLMPVILCIWRMFKRMK